MQHAAQVAELADAEDSKSSARKGFRVRPPAWAFPRHGVRFPSLVPDAPCADLEVMNSRRHSRTFGSVFLLLAILLVAEQGWVHECPMHAQAASGAAHDIASAHDAHAGHGAAALPHQEQAPASHHTDCKCLGDCTSSLVSHVGGPPASNVPAPAAVKNDRPRSSTPLPASANADHRLPFSIGPPALT